MLSRILTEINGKTTVSVEESMERFLAKLFRTTFNRNLERDMQHWLELLKQECKSESAPVVGYGDRIHLLRI